VECAGGGGTAVDRGGRGGQPLLLTRRGRPAAVLLDPDSWAELEQLADEALLEALA
jgi:prevent-host-death family protein